MNRKSLNNVSANIIKHIYAFCGNREYTTLVYTCKATKNCMYTILEFALKRCEIMFRSEINKTIIREQKNPQRDKLFDIRLVPNKYSWEHVFYVIDDTKLISIYCDENPLFCKSCYARIGRYVFDTIKRKEHRYSDLDDELPLLEPIHNGSITDAIVTAVSGEPLYKYIPITKFNKDIINILANHHPEIHAMIIPLYMYKFINSNKVLDVIRQHDYDKCVFNYIKYINEFRKFVLEDKLCLSWLRLCLQDEITIRLYFADIISMLIDDEKKMYIELKNEHPFMYDLIR